MSLFGKGYIGTGALLFVFYHVLGLLTMGSWARVISVRPSDKIIPCTEEEQREYSCNPIRKCRKCNAYKPDRAHHCAWCGRCVLKMDHHCPWLGNCIGGHNYKFFVQTIVYTTMFALFVSLSLLYFHSLPLQVGKKNTSAAVLVTVGFALSVGTGILSTMHLYLLFTNQTTLELGFRIGECERCTCQKPPFDVGWRDNFKIVFGQKWWMWCLPVLPTSPHGRASQLLESQQLLLA